MKKKTKLIWILVETPSPSLVEKLSEHIRKLTLEGYNFIITPSTLRPISLKALKKYLEALLQTVKDLEEAK